MTGNLITEHSRYIRRMDVLRDLNPIADLVEMSFPIQQDPDGQIYLQKMRKAARNVRIWGWLNSWAEVADVTALGFVWEEGERIVGNLSLIPFQSAGRRLYLIANVAVHHQHRRQGIARALTKRALNYLRRRNVGEVWLQVREDNLEAQALYRSVGFMDRAVRTTWRMQPCELRVDNRLASDFQYLRHRKAGDWPEQKKRLAVAYPLDIRWNYPIEFSRLAPGLFQYVNNLIDGIGLRNWSYDLGDRGQGQITWQKTNSFANNLWLAFNEMQEPYLLPGAMAAVFQHLSKDHPISIDYPKGRSEKTLEDLGFKPFRTLIWMACRL